MIFAMTLASRIKAARIALGMKKVELARAAGVTPGAVTQWENGTVANLRGEVLVAVSRVLKVSSTWLNTGKGDVGKAVSLSDQERDLLTHFRQISAVYQKTIIEMARALAAQQKAASNIPPPPPFGKTLIKT